MSQQPTVLIMAAGEGTRMRSSLPKVLHPICGRPMLEWVVAAAREAGARRILCVTRPGDGVADALPDGVEAVAQQDGEGTGAAVAAAGDRLREGETVLTLSGDHPLVSPVLIGALADAHARSGAAATLLTTEELDPAGYGRVVRGADGSVERIVETKSTAGVPAEELAIREVNIGAYAFASDALLPALEALPTVNGERYLTAVFPALRERGHAVAAYSTRDVSSAIGVNTRVQLMEVQALAQRRILERHALAGVSFTAPHAVSIEAEVEIGADSEIGLGVVLRGVTRMGAGCRVGPHATIVDSTLGNGVEVAQSHLVRCRVADGASIGPFAHLRPDADVGETAKIGTFVEVKDSAIGEGAKVPHLSYIGDADVGAGANVGAGNVTANYDGRRKHRTVIGDGARTGVNTSLVAPVHIGEGAYTGAGSVITEDVPDGALGISRPEQRNVEGYAERLEKERGS